MRRTTRLRMVVVACVAACGGGGAGETGEASEAATSSGTGGPGPTTGGETSSSSTTSATTGVDASGGGDGTSGSGATGTGAPGTGTTAGDETGAAPESLCTETPTMVRCPRHTLELAGREVHYQAPLGDPPAGGWPVVLMFQGSFVSAEQTWSASDGMPFGAIHQTRVVKRLLDDGHAVITPEAKLDGSTYWDTNIVPYATNWELSSDHQLMLAIFAAIADGAFGPLDGQRMFATGVSSGGYMTSRMAVSYPGKFRALAIAAGSYATCGGPLCAVPELDAGHPPTLLLQGELDPAVPLATVEAYDAALQAAGVDTRLVVDPAVGHAWIPAAPGEIGAWFMDHP